MRDSLGKRVPFHMREAFLGRKTVVEIADRITRQSNALNLSSGGARVAIDAWLVHSALQAVRAHILNRLPYAVCFLCEERGAYSTDCHCKGRGWLNKDELDEALYAVGGCEAILPKLGMRRFQVKTRNKGNRTKRPRKQPATAGPAQEENLRGASTGRPENDAG